MKRESIMKRVLSALFAIIIMMACAGSVFAADIKELTAAARPDLSGAICRVAITRDGAEVRSDPDSRREAVFNASEGAEYIAYRRVITHAGATGDGSKWYELIGMRGWDSENNEYVIAPSLEGRSAVGVLLDYPLYVSVKDVREIPLRDGDAEAVLEWFERPSGETDDAGDTSGAARLRNAVAEYAERALLAAESRNDDGVTVHRWYDSGDNDYVLSYVITEDFFSTSELQGSFTDTTFIAVPGAELAGLVIGSSTEADARALLGAPTGEEKIDGGAYSHEFRKLDLSGGVSVYGSDEIERTVSVTAARVISYDEETSEGVYQYIRIYIGEDGTISAIKTVFDNTLVW